MIQHVRIGVLLQRAELRSKLNQILNTLAASGNMSRNPTNWSPFTTWQELRIISALV